MAEKLRDFSNYGYPDERFEKVISENLHCAICSNVFKDPAMCKNEHCFCRACITEHLKNSQNCPCCNQHLTVESLSDAPRIVRNLLSEQRIRCDYHERGCQEVVQLDNLVSHVVTCTKAPVVCANDECAVEMNREDQARHESEECRFRKVKCRNCKEMDAMMQEIGASLGGLCEHVTKLNTNINEQLPEMKSGLTAVENRFGEMEVRFKKLENSLHMKEMKFRNKEDLEFSDERPEEMHDKEPTRSDQATQADLTNDKKDVYTYIVAGGYGVSGEPLDSVEIFDKTAYTWRQIQSMKKPRANASSAVYHGEVLVTGGVSDSSVLSSMEQLNGNPNPLVPPSWSMFSTSLPRMLRGHWSVVYNDRLLVFGGYDQEKGCFSGVIYEIQLHFPFNTKVLAQFPLKRHGCGVVQVDDKIFICGGHFFDVKASVTMYDITKNKFKELAPLPYGVCNMATVKYGENIIVVGGSDGDQNNEMRKKTVASYNIETQKSTMLPPMKKTRSECSAVVDGDSVVVMGGINQHLTIQNSVQAFDFRSSQWRTLPPMNEARRGLVAEIV